jgi:predicted ATPase/DNA-binding SARP family transcriptional activator
MSMPPPRLRISLLGGFCLTLDSAPVTSVSSARLQSLLAYLVLHRDAPQPRQQLAFLFWPGSSEAQARTNLRSLIHQLRQTLPQLDVFLCATVNTVQWRADAPFALDIAEFENALAQGALQPAIDLYHGDLMPGCYDDWIAPERERLQQRYTSALERLIRQLEVERDYRAAIEYAQRLLRYDPLREETYCHLMRLYALNRDRTGVARVYDTCVTVLRRELRLEPSLETRDTHERCVRIAASAHPDTEHRPSSYADTRLSNLPHPLTRFIGRESELSEVKHLIEAHRLVTLTGAGGVGKTRLAIQVAHQVLPLYPHGAWLVEFAPLVNPDLVPRAVETVLGVRGYQDCSRCAALIEYVRDKSLLLVLDNCEHVIEACAQLAEHMLHHCPNLRILATSREALHVEGEIAMRVPSLSLPPGRPLTREALERSEAVRLFLECAATALPSFALTDINTPAIAQVCRRLDGIALAIELAAAWVKTLRVEQIAARLDEAFRLLADGSRTALPRQRTLRATLDWSYDLLAEDERRLLRRLSVFAGGWTLEAAEAVCAGDRADAQGVLELLTELVNKSLVLVECELGEVARYRLLEMTRQYAHEKLVESGEGPDMCGRHLDYYLGLAERLEWQTRAASQAAGWKQALTELDNFRAAQAWSLAETRTTEVEKGLRLVSALSDIWEENARTRVEAACWLQQSLAFLPVDGGAASALVRAKALRVAGRFAVVAGMGKTGRAMLDESVALYRAANLADRRDLVAALTQLAYAWFDDDLATARALAEESVAIGRQLEPSGRWHLALALYSDGWVANLQGDYAAARSRAQEGLGLFRQVGDRRMATATIELLGHIIAFEGDPVAALQGDPAAARSFYQEALQEYQRMNLKLAVMVVTEMIAVLDYAAGDYGTARARFEETLAYFRDTGDKFHISLSLCGLGSTRIKTGDDEEAARLLRESLLLIQGMQTDRYGSMGLVAWAAILRARGDLVSAAILLGATESEANRLGNWYPSSRADYNQTLTAARAALGEEGVAAAMTRGRAMTIRQAIAYALEQTG